MPVTLHLVTRIDRPDSSPALWSRVHRTAPRPAPPRGSFSCFLLVVVTIADLRSLLTGGASAACGSAGGGQELRSAALVTIAGASSATAFFFGERLWR